MIDLSQVLTSNKFNSQLMHRLPILSKIFQVLAPKFSKDSKKLFQISKQLVVYLMMTAMSEAGKIKSNCTHQTKVINNRSSTNHLRETKLKENKITNREP